MGVIFGAGRGNRTLTTRSEAWDSTIKLYPHNLTYYTKKSGTFQQKFTKKSTFYIAIKSFL